MQKEKNIQRIIQLEWIKEELKAVERAEAQKISKSNEKALEDLVKQEALNLTFDETNYKVDRADIEYVIEKKWPKIIMIQNGKKIGYDSFNFNKQAIILVEDILNLFEEEFYIVYEYFPE